MLILGGTTQEKSSEEQRVTPEMFLLCLGFQQLLGFLGMAQFIFITRNPATTMHTVQSDPGWCQLPSSCEEGAQLLPELPFLLPAGWLE